MPISHMSNAHQVNFSVCVNEERARVHPPAFRVAELPVLLALIVHDLSAFLWSKSRVTVSDCAEWTADSGKCELHAK